MADRAQEDGVRLLQAIEEEHAERREGQPLQAFTPVVPEAAAQRLGLSSGDERYGAAVRWLEEQNAIEGDERAGDVGGKRVYNPTGRRDAGRESPVTVAVAADGRRVLAEA